MNEVHIASRVTGRHSPLFTLESGQSGLRIYTSQRDAALKDYNLGYAPRTRGVWFAPGIKPTPNGKVIVDLLKEAGKELPVGPGFKKQDPFLAGPDSPF